ADFLPLSRDTSLRSLSHASSSSPAVSAPAGPHAFRRWEGSGPLFFLSRHRHARNLHLDRTELGPGGKEQRFPVLTAKGQIRRGGRPVEVAAQLLAVRIQYPYPPRAATIHVAFPVHLHAIGHTGLTAA